MTSTGEVDSTLTGLVIFIYLNSSSTAKKMMAIISILSSSLSGMMLAYLPPRKPPVAEPMDKAIAKSQLMRSFAMKTNVEMDM